MAFLNEKRSHLKRAVLFLFSILVFLPALLTIPPLTQRAAAAADSFTLEGATSNFGTYVGGTLYIQNDALKAGLGGDYKTKGAQLTYASNSSGDVTGLTGGSVSWVGNFSSPQGDNGEYWCATTDGNNSRGSITIIMWQTSSGGQWNLTAFCNGSIQQAPNANAQPNNVPWGESGSSISISHPSVNVSNTQTPPKGNPTIPDVSSDETYAFQGDDGSTIHACNGIFKQFSGGCLDFSYARGQSQNASTTTAYFLASGTANTVCSVSMSIEIELASVKDGQSPTPAKLGGKDLTHTGSPKLLTDSTKACDDKAFNYKFFPKGDNEWDNFTKDISVTGTFTNFLGLGLSNTSDESDFIDCGSGGFNFFVCPALKLAIAAGNKIDSFIMNQLEVDATAIFDNTGDTSSPSNGYYLAWSQFRIIATSLLIIGGLVMIVSTALGFEFLDAYTIRKTLPRLLIAIIGISLSWPLMKLAVTFFDTVGFDIRSIMYGPFRELHGHVGVGTGILSYFTVGAGLFAFGPTALTFILTACLALFVGFLILVIRQAAIIMLVILAPVAIACFILPNTQKVWKLWSDNFFGLLLMFPIISALIAAGHIFAAVTISSNQGDSPAAVIAQAIAIIAYFIPYFLLPMAARLATGIIGNLAGFVNDRHKGAFDRLKGARDNSRQNRHQMRMNEQMSKGKFGNVYRRLSSVGTPNSGALGITRGGRAKYAAFRQNTRQQMAAEALKNDNGRAAGDDDATALAVQRGMTRSRFLSAYQAKGHSAQEAEMALATTERGFNAQIGSDAMALAAFKARAGSSTAYSGDAAGTQQRFNEGAALINAGILNEADATAAGKGNRARTDISGAGFSTQMKAFREAAEQQRAGGQMSLARASQHLDNVVQEAEPGDMLAGNTRTITAIAPAMMRNLKGALQRRTAAIAADDTVAIEAADRDVNRSLGQIAGIQDNLNRTSPQKAGMFADQVNGSLVTDLDGSQITVRKMVENAASRPAGQSGYQTFLEVRKEYGSARNAHLAGADAPPEPEEHA